MLNWQFRSLQIWERGCERSTQYWKNNNFRLFNAFRLDFPLLFKLSSLKKVEANPNNCNICRALMKAISSSVNQCLKWTFDLAKNRENYKINKTKKQNKKYSKTLKRQIQMKARKLMIKTNPMSVMVLVPETKIVLLFQIQTLADVIKHILARLTSLEYTSTIISI